MSKRKLHRCVCLSSGLLLALLTFVLVFWPLLFSDRTSLLFGLYAVFFAVLAVLVFSKELKFLFFWPLYLLCIGSLVGLVLWPLLHHGFSTLLVLLYVDWFVCCAVLFVSVFFWKRAGN